MKRNQNLNFERKMTKRFQKSVQDYISKVKKTPNQSLLHFSSNKILSSSANRLLGGCRHPKTVSIDAGNHETEDDAATLSDVDRFLFENFKSLYEEKNEEREDTSSEFTFDSPILVDPPSNLCGSNRFFVDPGSSGSLIEEARLSATTSSIEDSACNNQSTSINEEDVKRTLNPDDFIAVLKYSVSPYDEFRSSMQEMIEARLRFNNGKVGWDFMEELLFSYLNLNDKKSYKYILNAFVDLIIVLRENAGKIPRRSKEMEANHAETFASSVVI